MLRERERRRRLPIHGAGKDGKWAMHGRLWLDWGPGAGMGLEVEGGPLGGRWMRDGVAFT